MTEIRVAREQMVREQLQTRGITSERVLAAMGKVPRERFVPEIPALDAYADRAWPIECQQTISQPYIVALMTQALELTGNELVLEVGTGSGYQAAVLAELAQKVVSIERHARLSKRAQDVLDSLGYQNVELIVGDGSLGSLQHAPFDRIIVTAAADHCPAALLQQLREGGTLVMPLGDSDSQRLQAIRKQGDQLQARVLTGCRFVPLVVPEDDSEQSLSS